MRLGFAININIRPDVLVIDEALSVGDAEFKKKCRNKISEMIASGITVLYVSHSADSLREICTRTIYLKDGAVVFDGAVEAGLEKYEKSKSKKGK